MDRHTLTAALPFDFGHSLAFIRGFKLTHGEQRIDDSLRKTMRVLGQTVQFTVQEADTPGTLSCVFTAAEPLSSKVELAALNRVRFYLGLDDEMQNFYKLAKADRPFQPVVRALRGFHQVKFMTPFESAAWAILAQGTYTSIARSLKTRLIRAYGSQLNDLWAFPDAADLASVPEGELAEALGNARKSAYMAGLARAFAQVDEHWLCNAPHADVRAWLLELPGIGPWSALFIFMRGLGRGEHLFEGNVEGFLQEVGQAAEPYYGPLSNAGLRQIAERYGRWQGYWANYLRAAPAVKKSSE